MNRLSEISFSFSKIDRIQNNAFKVDNQSQQIKLHLNFDACFFTDQTFQSNPFDGIENDEIFFCKNEHQLSG